MAVTALAAVCVGTESVTSFRIFFHLLEYKEYFVVFQVVKMVRYNGYEVVSVLG